MKCLEQKWISIFKVNPSLKYHNELVDNTGLTIDVFGVISEDGNGTNWEYIDGRAVRNMAVSAPDPVFTTTQWTIFSDASNTNITNPNSPQNAPNDFNPRAR